jgi:pimeloyl-ACP methyl ester carboxylesterase
MVLMSALAPGQSGVPVPGGVQAKLSGAPGVTFKDVMAVLFPAPDVETAERCFRQARYRPTEYLSANIPNTVTAGQAALLKAWTSDDAAAAALRKLHLATLILSGDADEVVSVRNSEALKRLLPEANLLVIHNGGHAMMYQYPVALARAISTFAGH